MAPGSSGSSELHRTTGALMSTTGTTQRAPDCAPAMPQAEILHVDMDAFFASVEQRDDRALRGKPVLVGGRSRRAVVAAASYEARRFGVRSAMPVGEALRLCPAAIVVPPRHERYVEVSHAVFDVFLRYTPLVEGLSVDEAFLDVTGSRALFGDAVGIARAIKRGVVDATGLTASAGVAHTKFAAKIASDMNKPDGLTVVPEDERAFLAPLPIERMWGVGAKTAARLRALGYAVLGDLANARARDLEAWLGAWGLVAARLARGEDDRAVDPRGVAKSIGAEETYEEDLTSREEIDLRLLGQCARVAQRLLALGCSARTVVVKVKYADFTLLTRRASLPEPVRDTQSLHGAARALLGKFPLAGRRVRLTGISVAWLSPGPPPDGLFDDGTKKQRALEEVTRRVAERFEGAHLTRAALLGLDGDRANAVLPGRKRG